jgi:putative acetyltransferase
MTETTLTIRAETFEDQAAVDALQFRAFGNDAALPALVQDLRQQETPFPTTSLVAMRGGGPVLGHVMLSHAWLDGPTHMIDVMVLSPLGVEPAVQRQGIGTALIKAALEAAETLGAPFVMLEGNPRYYSTRGFEPAGPLGIRRPSVRIPEGAFQIAKLSGYTRAMTGTFVYKDVHWRSHVGLYPST